MARPATLTNTGPSDFRFEYQAGQKRLLRIVKRGGGSYLQLLASQNLEVGGQRSGKTVGKLIFGIQNYCLKFNRCDILVLRRTFPELDAGAIQDFKTFVPKELYDFNASTRVATFKNGSRVVFAGCANNVERDIEKYLGQAYPFILVDECAQFSKDVWERLYARNLVNASCEEDEFGNLPIPAICGCTNPIGAWWEYYHTLFVKKEPWEKEDGLRRAKDGSFWVVEAGEPRCVYNPSNYAFSHTTVLDNPLYLKRDPGMIDRLRALPPAKRKKFLEGYMDTVEGQYFDCWSPEYHVVDLRSDPEAVIWEPWQPVWGGADYGVGHWSAAYIFTKAQVRHGAENDYRLKTVCIAEIAPETTGHTGAELANMIKTKARYPSLPETHPQYNIISGKPCRLSALYFSHEKFNRQMERHSPADEFSAILRKLDLPSVSRASTDRIGSASFMYNELKLGKLCILATCPGIIQALPSLQRDKDNLDDVLKTDSKADDRYDGFRYGLYGSPSSRTKPQEMRDREHLESIKDPWEKYFFKLKSASRAKELRAEFIQKEQPVWMSKV